MDEFTLSMIVILCMLFEACGLIFISMYRQYIYDVYASARNTNGIFQYIEVNGKEYKIDEWKPWKGILHR